MQEPVPSSIDDLFRKEFPRLVRALTVVDGPEAAADAVQEAFIAADRRWRKVRGLASRETYLGPQPGALVRWVDGQWELWLAPDDPSTEGNARLLRARWDTERGEVVDVRTVADFQAAADDPLADEFRRDTDPASILFHQD